MTTEEKARKEKKELVAKATAVLEKGLYTAAGVAAGVAAAPIVIAAGAAIGVVFSGTAAKVIAGSLGGFVGLKVHKEVEEIRVTKAQSQRLWIALQENLRVNDAEIV